MVYRAGQTLFMTCIHGFLGIAAWGTLILGLSQAEAYISLVTCSADLFVQIAIDDEDGKLRDAL